MVIKFHAMKDMKILWKILEIYYNFLPVSFFGIICIAPISMKR